MLDFLSTPFGLVAVGLGVLAVAMLALCLWITALDRRMRGMADGLEAERRKLAEMQRAFGRSTVAARGMGGRPQGMGYPQQMAANPMAQMPPSQPAHGRGGRPRSRGRIEVPRGPQMAAAQAAAAAAAGPGARPGAHAAPQAQGAYGAPGYPAGQPQQPYPPQQQMPPAYQTQPQMQAAYQAQAAISQATQPGQPVVVPPAQPQAQPQYRAQPQYQPQARPQAQPQAQYRQAGAGRHAAPVARPAAQPQARAAQPQARPAQPQARQAASYGGGWNGGEVGPVSDAVDDWLRANSQNGVDMPKSRLSRKARRDAERAFAERAAAELEARQARRAGQAVPAQPAQLRSGVRPYGGPATPPVGNQAPFSVPGAQPVTRGGTGFPQNYTGSSLGSVPDRSRPRGR